MKVYNKLVRDRIPEIIASQAKRCEVRVLTDAEYLQALEQKLDEELAEYHASGEMEELADLLEVIHAIVAAKGQDTRALYEMMEQKAAARGRFENKLLLVSVDK